MDRLKSGASSRARREAGEPTVAREFLNPINNLQAHKIFSSMPASFFAIRAYLSLA
jgi:hypothetical protein